MSSAPFYLYTAFALAYIKDHLRERIMGLAAAVTVGETRSSCS